MAFRAAVGIELAEGERQELVSLARARKTGQAMARRARIVLAAAEGLENKPICARLGADANTVLERGGAGDRHGDRLLVDIKSHKNGIVHQARPPCLRLGVGQPGAILD
jgi:hypothetical protein